MSKCGYFIPCKWSDGPLLKTGRGPLCNLLLIYFGIVSKRSPPCSPVDTQHAKGYVDCNCLFLMEGQTKTRLAVFVAGLIPTVNKSPLFVKFCLCVVWGRYDKMIHGSTLKYRKERIFQVSFWVHIVHLFPTSESNGIWSAVFRSWKEKTATIPHSKHRICKKKIKRPSSEKCWKYPVTVTKWYYLYYLYPISSLPKQNEGANQRTNPNKIRKIRSITLPKALYAVSTASCIATSSTSSRQHQDRKRCSGFPGGGCLVYMFPLNT